MASDASPDGIAPVIEPNRLALSNFKALLKESLTEILRESPSLLHPPEEDRQGKYTPLPTLHCYRLRSWVGEMALFEATLYAAEVPEAHWGSVAMVRVACSVCRVLWSGTNVLVSVSLYGLWFKRSLGHCD